MDESQQKTVDMLLWIYAQGYCARHHEAFVSCFRTPSHDDFKGWSLDAEQDLFKRYKELERVFGITPSFHIGVDLSKVTYKCYKIFSDPKTKDVVEKIGSDPLTRLL